MEEVFLDHLYCDCIRIGFDIDEMVQAWSEMDDAKRWHNNVPSPRSTPVLRRRSSKLHHALEYA